MGAVRSCSTDFTSAGSAAAADQVTDLRCEERFSGEDRLAVMHTEPGVHADFWLLCIERIGPGDFRVATIP